MEHDVNLRKVLQRRREVNLKPTPKKCKIHLDQVPYVGHLFTKEGLKPDEAKVKAIEEKPPPDSPEALHRFLGMINYKNSFTWAILVSIRSRRSVRVHWVACGTCSVPGNFSFKLGGH